MNKYSKSMKRVLSFVLTFAMIASLVVYSPSEAKAAASKVVSAFTVSATSVTINTKATKTVSAKVTTVKNVSAANLKVTVATSNKSIVTAKVKTNPAKAGKVGSSVISLTGVKAGTAYVTVSTVSTNKSNKKVSKKIKVVVKDVPVTNVSNSTITRTSFYVGETAKITAKVLPATATNKKVTYVSSNSTVATVSSTGVVTGKKAGTARITVKSVNGKTKAFTVTVKNKVVAVSTLTLSDKQKAMKVGDTYVISANIAPINATNKTVTWTSDNKNIATVVGGKVTAVGAGRAIITAKTSNGKIATCTINVSADVKVSGITLDQDAMTLPLTETQKISATVTPNDAADKSVSFTSSNATVASVSNDGVVKANGVGEAIITATTNDGKYTATCKVKVVDYTSKNAKEVTINVANSLSEYANTVLTGTNADIRIQALNEAGRPVANKDISVEIKSEYTSGYSYAFGILNNGGISDKQTVKTDEDGYASLTIGLKSGADYTSTDEVYESFKLTATVTGSNVAKTESISFACIRMGGIMVMNNRDITLNDLAPHENAVVKTWNTIAHTWSDNGHRNNEFVTNQMHSSSSINNSVTFSATPVIIIPAKNEDSHMGTHENAINFKSTDYKVYNGSDNSNTTHWIKKVPAGLTYATLYFEDVVLSEYTVLDITVYSAADSSKVLDHTVKDWTNLTLENKFSYQLPVQENEEMDICVSLISEGQVNLDKNDGYTITKLLYKFANETANEGAMHDIGSVKWQIESSQYDAPVEMTLDEAKHYINDSKFLSTAYKYQYKVPAYPTTGDAYIYVTDKNNDIVGIFSYPAENTWLNNDATEIKDRTVYPTQKKTNDKNSYTLGWAYSITPFNYEGVINEKYIKTLAKNDYGMYRNKNDIKLRSDYDNDYAVYVSKDEASRDVGEIISTKNNTCTVDSKETGSTRLVATVSVPSLSKDQLNDQNGAELHTSVQWAPLPVAEEEDEADDFYAIKTQTVKVIAQVVDGQGQKVAKQGATVKFFSDDMEIKNNGTLPTNTQVNVKDFNNSTDKEGRAYISFLSSDVTGFVSNLTATCTGYNVVFYVGRYETPSKKANISWIDLGLAFTDRAAYKNDKGNVYKQITTSTLNGKQVAQSYDKDGTGSTIINTVADRPVGTNWLFGYKLVGKLVSAKGYEVSNISNVNVSITQKDETGMKLVNRKEDSTLKNGECKVYSQKNVSAEIIGQINAAEAYSDVDATDVAFTVVDSLGKVVGVYQNVGVGTPSISAKLSINFNWETVGKKADIYLPNGNKVAPNADTKAYVRVYDNFGNPIKDATVKYSVDGIITKAETTVKTDSNGYVVIELTKPATTGNVSISAKVDDTVDAGTASLSYNNTTNTSFAAMGARLDKDSSGKNFLKVVYTSDVNPETAKNELYSIKSSVNEKTYKIDKVVVDSTYRNVVNIYFNDDDAAAIINDMGYITVTTNNVELNKIEYKLTDTNGRYIGSQNSVIIAPKKEFTIEAEYVSGKVKIVVKDDAKQPISTLDSNYGKICAYSSLKTVIGSTGYKVLTAPGSITVTQADTAQTVYVYYCGYWTSVQVDAK